MIKKGDFTVGKRHFCLFVKKQTTIFVMQSQLALFDCGYVAIGRVLLVSFLKIRVCVLLQQGSQSAQIVTFHLQKLKAHIVFSSWSIHRI